MTVSAKSAALAQALAEVGFHGCSYIEIADALAVYVMVCFQHSGKEGELPGTTISQTLRYIEAAILNRLAPKIVKQAMTADRTASALTLRFANRIKEDKR